MDNTNAVIISNAIQAVLADTKYIDAFWLGLQFGFQVVVFCFALSMLRTIPGDDTEEI